MSGKKTQRPHTRPRVALVDARRAARPHVTYPDNLPVSAQRDMIMSAIAANQVVVISGETGSGKTTQIPKMCLDVGRGIHGMIGHTQPRRLAARSVAARIASELGCELGQAVGYQVRFTDQVSDSTMIKLMTDGILLAEIQHDPDLLAYDTIIVDEAHERSLNIDFILGYLARLLPRRPDLKLIITSATIDAERFAAHFSAHLGVDVPTIDVSGRTYPVELRYRPLDDNSDIEDGICDAVDELLSEGQGDILVFLPGERDIREAELALIDHLRPPGMSADARNIPVDILPLFARLSPADQNKIFQPHQRRRIILSTNIAETSLTVPGIRFVVDPGLARISRYSSRTKVQRLPIEEVSQASANQRSGRCGRVEAGIAIRLYDEENFDARPAFTEPEILRTSLASVILSMAALKLGAVEDFPFIDPPSHAAIANGIQLLIEIGAVRMSRPRAGHKATSKTKPYPVLTRLGRQLSHLPIDPRLGRMLLEADRIGCLSEVLIVVAALSMQDVRLRPLDKENEADASHRRFTDKTSDFATYVNLWRYIRTQHRDLSRRAFRTMCHNEYLHYLRILEWQDVVGQLRQMLRDIGLKARNLSRPSPQQISAAAKQGDAPHQAVIRACAQELTGPHGTNVDDISQAMLSGLLSNIGVWNDLKGHYDGARQQPFVIWPGSGLARVKKHPEWVMAAELVETSRTFARNVAVLDPTWIEPLAKHLVKRTYTGVFWSSSRGAAMVTQRVSLYGLVLTEKPVTLASLGPQVLEGERPDPVISNCRYGPDSAWDIARAMFIRHALVGGDWRSNPGFQRRNQATFARIDELEQRTRQAGLRADDDTLVEFFDQRIGQQVTNATTFASWWKEVRPKRPDLLDIPWQVALYRDPLGSSNQPRMYTSESDAQPSETLSTTLQGELRTLTDTNFPPSLTIDGMDIPLSYVFSPGSPDDGVTATINVSQLQRLTPDTFSWLVPGLRSDLIEATIRALPKAIRRHLVPAPKVASELNRELEHGHIHDDSEPATTRTPQPGELSLEESLAKLAGWAKAEGKLSGHLPNNATSNDTATPSTAPSVPPPSDKASQPQPYTDLPFGKAFANAVHHLYGVHIPLDTMRESLATLPDHLQMTLRLVDDNGHELASSRYLTKLQQRYRAHVQRDAQSTLSQVAGAQLPAQVMNKKFTSWPQSLPHIPLVIDGDADKASAFPAFSVDSSTTSCSVVAHPQPFAQENAQRDAIIYLLAQDLRLSDKRIVTRLNHSQRLLLTATDYPDTTALVDACHLAAARWVADAACANDSTWSFICHGPTPALPVPELPALFDPVWDSVRTGQIFDRDCYVRLRDIVRDQLEEAIYQILVTVVECVEYRADIDTCLDQGIFRADALRQTVSDSRWHMDFLLSGDFLARTPSPSLSRLPLYCQAERRRLHRAKRDVNSDLDALDTIDQARQLVDDALHRFDSIVALPKRSNAHSLRGRRDQLRRAQWLVEELRISLFAQELGTVQKISLPRLRSFLNKA